MASSNDPILMDATPKKKALLDTISTQIQSQTANQYGYSPYQTVGSLPAHEQDAILGDLANQITYKGGITVTKDDIKQLPVFNNTTTISAKKPSLFEGLADIGANLGEGIVQGVTGRTTDYYGDTLHDKFGILGSPNNEWVRNITAIPTGLAVGAGLTLANPFLGAGWFGATSANQALEANQQASQEAGAIGDFNQAQKIKDLQGQSAGIAGTAGALTSFLPAYLGKGLAKKALTGAGLGYAQDYATRKALDYATTGTADASLVAPEMGTLFGAGFPLAGAGFKHLLDKRAGKGAKKPHVEVPPEQIQQTKQAIQTDLQSPDINVRLKARHADLRLKRYEAQAKGKTTAFNTKNGAKVPDNVPHSAEVAKPANVDVSKTETTTGETTRTDVLKASLEKKEAKLNDLFENQFSHWKQTNGQPMNDKRSGASHFKKSDKNDDAIRNQLAEIEKTKKAIEKEAVKVEQSKFVKNSLPPSIVELLDSGKITQWRKFPDTFFVKGVDKGRFQYKDGVLSNRYYRDIPTQEQKAIFKDLYNTLNGKIEQPQIEAPTAKESSAIEAKIVEPMPTKGLLKNGDKAPPVKDGESFDDYRARLEKQVEKGMGLKKESLLNGKVSLYEKTSKKIAGDKADADIGAFTGKPLKELSNDELLKASEHFRDKAPSPETTKANERIKKLANDRILEADAKGEDTTVLRDIEANAIVGLDVLTEQGKTIAVKDAPTAFEEGIKNLKENGNVDIAKVKAETKAIIDSIDEAEMPIKAINKGSRDIDTQLQDLKALQGTQPQTPDDIRRGAGVLMGHDSFLAKETLEALGYPLKYKKFSGDANSIGWSVQIGGKKVQLYKGDSLGSLLRRNKLEGAFEAGLVKRKAGDVVKGLIDDLDPKDLTLNETDLKQKLTAYGEGLPKDGGLLTSREAEAFTLLDNAKTPEELNAVEKYVSERENDYQDGFHEEFYKHWDDRHKALEADYQGKVDNRVAKADDTRQLKATEELKKLRKQLEVETNKVLKLENEMALLSPTVRLERTLQNKVLKDAKTTAKKLKYDVENGNIDDAQFTRIVEGLSPEARNALAEEFSC